MSDLHKRLLSRVRQQEQALGFSLSEEPELEEEGTEDGTAHAETSPAAPFRDQQPPSAIPTPTQGYANNSFPLIPPAVFPKMSALAGAGSAAKKVTSPAATTAANDAILANYHKVVHDVFPIQEKYASIQTYYRPPGAPGAPIFVCHHGAGSSAVSFTVLTRSLQEKWDTDTAEGGDSSSGGPGVFAFDMRGHGKSDSTTDFSLEALTADFASVFAEFERRHLAPSGSGAAPKPSIYFIGHSLGGAVLTNFLTPPDAPGPARTPHPAVKGLVMLDIVEETAVKSLVAMPTFIKRRPRQFDSYQRAIDWHIKETRLLHNEESARISVPALLARAPAAPMLAWITDLQLTQPFWETWFKGLSSHFVTCGSSTAKLLILAGHENLDTDLIIGQMQGKYQLIVFNNTPNAGHFIHEDVPNHIASSLLDFIRRNDSPEEYMKKEFGFVPKWGGKINQ